LAAIALRDLIDAASRLNMDVEVGIAWECQCAQVSLISSRLSARAVSFAF
jgi:hypothetical protein